MTTLTKSFYEQYKGMALTLAADYFSVPEDAEDAAQEVFVKLLRVSRFIPKAQDEVAPWVYTVADNMLKDLKRKEHALNRLNGYLAYDRDEVVDFDDPQTYNERKEAAERFAENYEALSDPYRETFDLRYGEHKSYKEIAEITGVSLDTVATRLHRAKSILLGE